MDLRKIQKDNGKIRRSRLGDSHHGTWPPVYVILFAYPPLVLYRALLFISHISKYKLLNHLNHLQMITLLR